MALVIGNDKNKSPIILCRVKYMDNEGSTEERMKKYALYTLETAIARMESGVTKYTFLLDMKDAGFGNINLKLFKDIAPIIQNCYPERISKVHMVNMNWIMKTIWKLSKELMEETTLKKVLNLYKVSLIL